MGWVYELLIDPARVATLRGQWLRSQPPAPLHPADYAPLPLGDPVPLLDLVVRFSSDARRARLSGTAPFPADIEEVAGLAVIDPDGVPLIAVGITPSPRRDRFTDGLQFSLLVQSGN